MMMRARNILILLAALAAGIATVSANLQTDIACREPSLPDTFFGQSELMTIRVTVFDATGEPIRGLAKSDFVVREDGEEQTIWRFSASNLSLTGGFVIDASDRMRETWPLVGPALAAFARARGRTDAFFVSAFDQRVDDRLSADAPFTRDPAVLAEAVAQPAAGRGAALYDAIDHGLDYVARGGQDRRGLIVITGGGDKTSRVAFEQLSERLTTSPTEIYVAGVFDPAEAPEDARTLRELSALTGGSAAFVTHPIDIAQTLQRVARDLAAAYSIGFAPPNPDETAKLRRLTVQLRRTIPGSSLRYRNSYRGGAK